MAKFTVRKGKRYWAAISLGWLESWASNDTVAQKIANAGFAEVEFTGDAASARPRHFGRLTMRLQRSPAKSAR
ncbi:MAG TPA: hypothetical protein VGY14_05100 [Methyloceanibacter sp.]|jgi:hypothetical protein|nr:hypothetical protein [Methyloceanibacter sp.]